MNNILLQNITSLTWLGTSRYNFIQSQLDNQEGELHQIKRSREKTKIGKETI